MEQHLTTKAPKWVLPAEIPFDRLKGRDLEECVYWLLDAMGGRDLEWRTGGIGGGAADGGRDIAATFYASTPDGEMEPDFWWVECKGRSGTVEPDAVKNAIVNAEANTSLAYIVIVTNSVFSNPTRDWVKNWQASRQRPKVKLWDRGTLEKLISNQPSVVLRLFSEALSIEGRLEAMRERFWNKLEYVPVKALEQFWNARSSLVIGALERFALLVNEFAHGNIIYRPWAAAATPVELVAALQLGLINVPYLFGRSSTTGVDNGPIVKTLSHLVLAALQRVSADEIARIVLTQVANTGDRKPDKETLDAFLMPIMDIISAEMRDVCGANCERFTLSDRCILDAGDDPVETYWRRFYPNGEKPDDAAKTILQIEKTDFPCNVGFPVGKEQSCPLFAMKPTVENMREFLSVIERVSGFRLAEARAAQKKG